MDIWKLNESSACSSLAEKHGEGGRLPAKENSETTHNSVLNAGYFHSSTLSTPIQTSCGLQAPSQTPASKLAFISASGYNKQQPIGAGQKASEDAVITRTPLRLLAANNKIASLFSPSPLERLGSPACSPALLGKARRVFVMPPELISTPRRVLVKQKSSEATNAVWQSPYLTPKKHPFATPTSNKTLETACQKDDRHHHDALQQRKDMSELPRRVLACTPQRTPLSTSRRAGHVPNPSSQKHDVKVENSPFPKRMLAFTHQQSPCATPISSTKGTSASLIDGIASDGIAKQHFVTGLRDDDMRLDRLALLKGLLASTPARRVPIQQKPKQPSKTISSQRNEKKPSQTVPSSETPKATSTDRTKVGTFGKTSNNARQKSTGKAKQQSNDGIDEINFVDSKQQDSSAKGTDEAKQQCGDGVDEISVVESKQHEAREEGTDEAKQECGDGVDETRVGESKQLDANEEGTGKVNQQCGDGVGAVQVDGSKERDARGGTDHAKQQCHDAVHKLSVGNSKQHDDGANCTDNLNASKDMKHRRAIKDTSSAKVKHYNEKKSSKKMSPSVTPNGKAGANRCKGKQSSKNMSFLTTPIGSTNVKRCEEKKTSKKASSLEAPIGCKAGQPRVQSCRNHGKTVDGRKRGTNEPKQQAGDAFVDSKAA